MPAPSLAQLNDRIIAVDLVIAGRQVCVRGTGHFEALAETGPVLKIHVADEAGEFDILLQEGRFSGPICKDAETGEFHISLEARNLCTS